MLQIRGNWQFTSVVDDIVSADEENYAASAAAEEEEEELRHTDPERRMEAAAEVDKISERGMKEDDKEAEVKAIAAKATIFLLLLVRVCTDRCTMF